MAEPQTPTPAGRKKNVVKVDPNQSPRDRFVRLAQLRTGNSIESIRKLALLANKTQYEYGDDDILKIEKALKDSVNAAIAGMKNGRPSQSSFKL